MEINDFRQVGEFEWELGRDYSAEMHVPVVVFSDLTMLERGLEDKSMEQAVNAACLPGVEEKICVMPDFHQGYGFPIGGVAATSLDKGVISPGAIGYDINCGVRLMASRVHKPIELSKIERLLHRISALCPSGVGKEGLLKLSRNEVERVCVEGAQWAKNQGYCVEGETDYIEDNGRINGADPSTISARAIQRGSSQLGTLGAGNHFIEVDIIDKIFDPDSARRLGLFDHSLVVQIHSGSRGLGHQICTEYVKDFQETTKKYHFRLPDRELVCAPLSSIEGRKYLSAMGCAANFAFVNRQMLAFYVREAFDEIFQSVKGGLALSTVYDLAHNIGKIERYTIDGKEKKVCVHRKGATRAFGPGASGIPEKYRTIGQPVLIPGSMGTSSWVMLGSQAAKEKSFSSCSHGAGRVMSRSKARRAMRGEQILQDLNREGIFIKAKSMAGLAEEAPHAYKDVNRVIRCIEGAHLARRVARLRPIAVLKG